ncbi:MAG: T9SS type A sorting domain-containing protein [Crocinitomicaceae bacterium]|nr:T9SS type A sorting domain-containing protein [Crocinitomicaceae bacterium]
MKKIFLSAVLTALIAITANAQAPTNGLVVHYKFDQNLNDNSGNGYHATAINTPSYTDVSSELEGGGHAINTNEAGGVYYDYASNMSEFQLQDFTYSVWVKVTGWAGNPYINFIENGEPTGNHVFIRYYDGYFDFGYYKAGGNTHMSSIPLSTFFNTWHLLTLTSEMVNGERIMKFYQNDELKSSYTYATQVEIQYDNNYSKFNIGRREGFPEFTPIGLINDTYVYNRPLTAEEVTQIFAEKKLGINESANPNIFEVYPNPATTELKIVAKKQTSISVLNTIGVVVATQNIVEGNNTIDVRNLTNGIYFIQTADGSTIKFVVAK